MDAKPLNSLAATTAVVLAGGVGSRLRSVVSDRPKVLAPIHGRPFLAYLLDRLQAAGIQETVLCTGYMADLVEETIGPAHGRMQVLYSRETAPLGTGGALRAALSRIQAQSILVLNGDSFCDTDLTNMAAIHRQRSAEATLLLTEVPDTQRFGRVRIADDGHLLAFDEKGAPSGPGWINAGVYLLDRRLAETIPQGRAVSLEKEVFPAWIGRGLYGHAVRGRFLDIGTPQSFSEAEAFFSKLGGDEPRAVAAAHDSRTAGGRPGSHTAATGGADHERKTRRFVVLDRDGTINVEREYLSRPEQIELLPGAAAGLRAMRTRGFGLVIVTNQSALGRGYFDTARLEEIHARLRGLLAAEGVDIDGIYVCPHTPKDGCDCRKPLPGLLSQAARELGFDPAEAVVIGDKPCDIDLGRAVGAMTILVRTGYGAEHEAAGTAQPDYVADDLVAAAELVRRAGRAELAKKN